MEMRLPLEGIVVADFCWALAGPFFTKNLAEHGATVIRIESSTRLDMNRRLPPYKDGIPGINRAPHFNYTNNDKLGITLNLKHPRGLELAKRLIARADVVTENFTPGTMKKFGLDYQELVKIKPDIIMVSLSMQGQTGPHSRYAGFGWLLQGLSGLQHISGFPDKPPITPGPQVTDYAGAYCALMATMSALAYRHRTGKGQHIDLSQLEVGVSLLGALLLDYGANGRDARPLGNRHSSASPHGIFRCQGDDRWCAIGVFTDSAWDALVRAMAGSAWAAGPRFATLSRRKANEDELEKLVEAWSLEHTAEQVIAVLQSAGIPAGVVQNGRDLFEDPQLRSRSHYQELEHVEVGRHHYEAPAFKLSRTPAQLRRAAPILGQDNEYVYKEFLGLSEQEYVDLLLSGAFE